MCQVIYFISSNILIDTSNLVYDIIDVYDLFTILFNCNLIWKWKRPLLLVRPLLLLRTVL